MNNKTCGECKYFVEEKGYCRLLDMVDISYSEDACGVFEAKTDNDTQHEVKDELQSRNY